jgi:hypothetical protein
MGLFSKKDPIDKWRRRSKLGAAFADHTGWQVNPDVGVFTTIDGQLVNVLFLPSSSVSGMSSWQQLVIEAGRQAERSHANQIGDDGGEEIEFEGFSGQTAPGSGVLEGAATGAGTEAWDRVVRAAEFLVARIS